MRQYHDHLKYIQPSRHCRCTHQDCFTRRALDDSSSFTARVKSLSQTVVVLLLVCSDIPLHHCISYKTSSHPTQNTPRPHSHPEKHCPAAGVSWFGMELSYYYFYETMHPLSVSVHHITKERVVAMATPSASGAYAFTFGSCSI